MKTPVLHKIALGFFLVLMTSVFSFGQFMDLERNMNCNLEKQFIHENEKKSLVIYAEFNENGIKKGGSHAGKIREVEFDFDGNVIYNLWSSNGGNLPFVYYGKGSKLEIKEFDSRGNMTDSHFEDELFRFQTLYTYDEQGRKLTEESRHLDNVQLKQSFEWKKDKLVKHTILFADDNNKKSVNKYDEKGRVIKWGWGGSITTFDYQQKGDTLITTASESNFDSLSWTTVEMKIGNNPYPISYVKRGSKNQLKIEMKAEYDEHGNATYFYLNDLTETYLDDVDGKSVRIPYPPSTYEIRNFYNNENLLMKREFYYSREDVGKDKLIKIERYVFDSDSLPFRFEKGKMMDKIRDY